MSSNAVKYSLRFLVAALMIFLSINALAQNRNVTPVESDDEMPQQPTLHYYDKHGKLLDEPVLFIAELDTVKKVNAGPVYPLLTDLTLGVNIWDLAMSLTGQAYKGFDIHAQLPLWNWLIPTVQVGLGWSDKNPKDGNYRYHGKPSLYTKIGADYNFLYKSDPDYQLLAGFRIGYSPFSYEINDVSISSGYWQQDNVFNIPDQKSSAVFGELVAGIKVKIWKRFSMGWKFRYHFMMHCKDADMSTPAYVPGYGSRTGNISASFSLMYTLPLKKK